MSRRSQDIPIRPRYGYLDSNNELENEDATRRPPQRNAENTQKMNTPAASYTEIPFLAQFLGDEGMPTEQRTSPEDVNADDCDSEEEENTNSKDSNSGGGEQAQKPQRPNSLHCDSTFPYELEGATSSTGEMRHFVAHNLEAKLREGSPQRRNDYTLASEHTTPSTSTAPGGAALTRRFLQSNNMPIEIDGNVLSDIELETQYLASSVDNLMENLGNLLHSISSITADNVEVHKNAVNKLTDSMDANIKCMYTIMAKTEEITKAIRPTEQLGQRIREIKRLVDMLDNTM